MKLTKEQRNEIRAAVDCTSHQLAARYGLTVEYVSRLRLTVEKPRKERVDLSLRRVQQIYESVGLPEDLAAHFNVSVSTIRRIKKGAPRVGVMNNRGEKHGRNKLTLQEVLKIKKSTERGVDLAARYGVDDTTICNIRSGRSWHWI